MWDWLRNMTVDQQDARIAQLDAASRVRALTVHESDTLAELIRRSAWRQYMRDRRKNEQIARAQARLEQLHAA